jgi:hypothetical protein
MESNFINNIIFRLRKFAINIEVREALVDKVWVIYGDNDLIEYEFERNGEISVTKNGLSYDGTWRILGSGRLKIKTDFANNILLYDFTLPGVLVMKIAGNQSVPFLLFDPNIVRNGDLNYHINHLESQALLPSQTSKPKQRTNVQDDSFSFMIGYVALFAGLLFCLYVIFSFLFKVSNGQ